MPSLSQSGAGAGAAGRKSAKLRLVRLMYDRGYSRAEILELFRIIDWMIRVPAALERAFLSEVYAIEEAKKMPYAASAERFGTGKGRIEGKLEARLPCCSG